VVLSGKGFAFTNIYTSFAEGANPDRFAEHVSQQQCYYRKLQVNESKQQLKDDE
jgi:hypothetical protein